MFAKLLKHEWRATRPVIGLLCAIILIAGIVLGGISYYLVNAGDRGDPMMVNVVCVLLLVAGMIAIAVCCAGSLCYVIYRFYKRCFTDEGYLTYTLPVNNHQILLSSISNCVLSELLTLLAALAAICIAAAFYLAAIGQNQEIIWADLWIRWDDVWQQLVDSFWKNIHQFAIVGFSGIFGALAEIILLMLSVTIGSLIARKHKILAGAGSYFCIGMVESFLTSFLFVHITPDRTNLFLATPGILSIVIVISGYFLIHWLTSKKLNLA